MRRSARTDLCGGRSANDRPYRVRERFPARCRADSSATSAKKTSSYSSMGQLSEAPLNSTRPVPSVWLMGLSSATLGLSNGMIYLVVPQFMAAAHVPELKIAAITAIASTPGFWFVFFAPILDVRFSRRWYATLLALLSGIAAAIAILSLHHLLVLQVAMVIGGAAAILSSSALGGWLSNITPDGQKNLLSKWMNIALFSGEGLVAAVGGEFVRRLPVIPAAILIGAIIFLPCVVFLFIPAPGPDRRLAGESF